MRTPLVLLGLLAASPAFAQSATTTPRTGTGNYNLSGSYGGANSGISVLGNSTMPGMNVGGSSLGNGTVGTAYGTGSPSAGRGITLDGNGLSDGMSALPSPGPANAPSPGGKLHPMR
jgi:hypothetical protein